MGLKDELQKQSEFFALEEEAFLSILRTEAVISGNLEAKLKEHGITEQQYNALRILYGAGEDGLPALEIGRRMVTRVPDVSRLICRLEKQGWVQRQRCHRDRRVTYIHLTAKGHKKLKELKKPIESQVLTQLSSLNEEDLQSLITILEKVRHRPD